MFCAGWWRQYCLLLLLTQPKFHSLIFFFIYVALIIVSLRKHEKISCSLSFTLYVFLEEANLVTQLPSWMILLQSKAHREWRKSVECAQIDWFFWGILLKTPKSARIFHGVIARGSLRFQFYLFNPSFGVRKLYFWSECFFIIIYVYIRIYIYIHDFY
jgi:hypothetical protein